MESFLFSQAPAFCCLFYSFKPCRRGAFLSPSPLGRRNGRNTPRFVGGVPLGVPLWNAGRGDVCGRRSRERSRFATRSFLRSFCVPVPTPIATLICRSPGCRLRSRKCDLLSSIFWMLKGTFLLSRGVIFLFVPWCRLGSIL